MKTVYSLILFFSMMICSLFALETGGKASVAVLAEGTVAVKGLPGFISNRIPSVFAKYKMDGGRFISVWAASEPLVFDPGVWTEKKAGAAPVFFTVTPDNRQLWVLRKVMPMREEMKDSDKWWFVFEFEGTEGEAFCRSFIEVCTERAESFFSAARRRADLSFPATLTVTGN